MLTLTLCWRPGCCRRRLPQHLVLVLQPGRGRQTGQLSREPRSAPSSSHGRSPPHLLHPRGTQLGWMNRVETPKRRSMFSYTGNPCPLYPCWALVASIRALALRDGDANSAEMKE